MSAILGFTVGAPTITGEKYNVNDDVLQPPDYRRSFPMCAVGLDRDSDVLWTRSSFPSQLNAGYPMESSHQLWEYNLEMPTGVNTRRIITGTIFDANGNPVSGAIVQLFNTSTGALLDTQTSDTNGIYYVTDPKNANAFVVSFLSGLPDTFGTTEQNL